MTARAPRTEIPSSTDERLWLVAAVAVRVVVVLVALHNFHTRPVTEGYVDRFSRIATSEGRPYRDFAVEYPPGTLAVVELVGSADYTSTATRLLWVSVVADAATAVVLLRGWGRRAAVGYLVLGIPLLMFLYLGTDLVSVALAVGGVALVRQGRERSGASLLAAAVFTKIWPIVLVPALLLERRWKALGWLIAFLGAGTGLWVAWGGWAGPVQVLTFRHAPGWEFESTIGSLVWTFTNARGRFVKDTPRLGVAPGWAKLTLLVVGLVVLGLVWRRARSRATEPMGAAATAAVASLLVVSPVLTFSYVIWLLPWAAIAWADGERVSPRLTMAVGVLTGALVASYGAGLSLTMPRAVGAGLILRNVVLAAIPVVWLAARDSGTAGRVPATPGRRSARPQNPEATA